MLGDIFRTERKFEGHSFGSIPKTDPVAIAQNLQEISIQNHFQSFSHHEKPTYSRKNWKNTIPLGHNKMVKNVIMVVNHRVQNPKQDEIQKSGSTRCIDCYDKHVSKKSTGSLQRIFQKSLQKFRHFLPKLNRSMTQTKNIFFAKISKSHFQSYKSIGKIKTYIM